MSHRCRVVEVRNRGFVGCCFTLSTPVFDGEAGGVYLWESPGGYDGTGKVTRETEDCVCCSVLRSSTRGFPFEFGKLVGLEKRVLGLGGKVESVGITPVTGLTLCDLA